jgi:hypothetical protein
MYWLQQNRIKSPLAERRISTYFFPKAPWRTRSQRDISEEASRYLSLLKKVSGLSCAMAAVSFGIGAESSPATPRVVLRMDAKRAARWLEHRAGWHLCVTAVVA